MNRITARETRSGVALIVVLGLIAVFMLSAVSFSISMRQERQGSARLRDGVQVRHVLWSGLSSAIDQINKSMDNGGSSIVLYPDWDASSSRSNNVGFSPPTAVLNSPFMEKNIPAATHYYLGNTNYPSYWGGVTNSTGAIKGRFAYIIVNAAEYLDVSMLGTTNRRYGKSCGEIDISAVADITNGTKYVENLKKHVAYENLAELVSLNPLSVRTNPSDIVTWSMSPVNETIDSEYYPIPKVCIGGEVEKLIPITLGGTGKPGIDAKIKAAFVASGVSDYITYDVSYYPATYAYSNLLDYVDSDSIPRMEPFGPNGEAVPMIYAVEVVLQVNVGAGVATVTARPYVKWFYPFLNQSASKYCIDCYVEFKPGTGAATNTFASLVPGSNSAMNISIPLAQGSTYAIASYAVPSVAVSQSGVTNPSFNINLDVSAKARIKIDDGSGIVVDSVPGYYAIDVNTTNSLLKFNLSTVVNTATPLTVITNWIEAYDPRFNWDATNVYQWIQGNRLAKFLSVANSSFSWSAPNASTMVVMTNCDKAHEFFYTHMDGDTMCYVANKPLENVGELGNLVIKPWTTIRLFDPSCPNVAHGSLEKYHKVLDYFYVSPTNSNYKRGVINVNTLNTNVLAAAFTRCPSAEWTNSVDYSHTIIASNALKIAEALVKGGPYRTVSEIGSASSFMSLNTNWFRDLTIPSSTNDYELMREGAIRNTADMLTTRYNCFFVIVKAEAYSEGMGGDKSKGTSLASAYAIAEVWRDPFRMYEGPTKALDGNGKPIHRTLIRSFRIIDE